MTSFVLILFLRSDVTNKQFIHTFSYLSCCCCTSELLYDLICCPTNRRMDLRILVILVVNTIYLTEAQVKFQTSIVPGPSHIGIPSACFLRVDPGPCGRDIVRVYYDHKTYTCKAFSYSGLSFNLLVGELVLMRGIYCNTGCGGNMNRFVSVKNCYKLCHPYYRQQVIESETPATLENSIVTGSPVLMPQRNANGDGTTMVPVLVKSVSGGLITEDKGLQDPQEDGVDSQMVMIQPAK